MSATAASGSAQTCVVNTCGCTNGVTATGVAATGAACTSNGANICTSCSSGYYKNGNACTGCRSACGTGFTQTTECSSAANRVCTQNVCTCTNGVEATLTACTADNAHICASCDGGYYPSSTSCSPFQGSCSNGDLIIQSSRTVADHCGTCDKGYHVRLHCSTGQGQSGVQTLSQTAENSESACLAKCLKINGCIAFDYTEKVQQGACRTYGKNTPRTTGGNDNRKYCSWSTVVFLTEINELTNALWASAIRIDNGYSLTDFQLKTVVDDGQSGVSYDPLGKFKVTFFSTFSIFKTQTV